MDEPKRDTVDARSQLSDDDAEYELEAPDESVLANERRRDQQVAEEARKSIDIDAIYRESERERASEILEHWAKNFRFQFQVKHLLVATAVLAIALTLYKLALLGTTLVLLFMGSVFGLYAYLQWEEHKQQAETNRKREELYARRRAKLQSQGTAAGGEPIAPAETLASEPLPGNEATAGMTQGRTTPAFRFQFSMRDLAIAMTAAAIMLGMIRILGGPAPTATILGIMALAGLLAFALGFEPPQIVILGWWFILIFYVLLSLLTPVWMNL